MEIQSPPPESFWKCFDDEINSKIYMIVGLLQKNFPISEISKIYGGMVTFPKNT